MDTHEEKMTADVVQENEEDKENKEDKEYTQEKQETQTGEVSEQSGGQNESACDESVVDADVSRTEPDVDSPEETHSENDGKHKRGKLKLALKCAGVILLLICISGVIYFNFLLDKIDYKDAKEFMNATRRENLLLL